MRVGDLLVVNYVGETWDDGKVFDSSFDRGAPASFQIGVGKVITGLGRRPWSARPSAAGSSWPSRRSSGTALPGSPSAGISGTDTLVFVVDIIAAYPAGSAATADSTPASPDLTGLPAVTGLPGAKPTITVPAGATPPTEITAVVLATGDGRGSRLAPS